MDIHSITDLAREHGQTESSRPTADKILSGDPAQWVRNQYASACGQLNIGTWEGEVGQWAVHFSEHEYCEILKGVSVLRDQNGDTKTVRAGDRFVVPAGFSGTWEVLETCRKVYVSFEQNLIASK